MTISTGDPDSAVTGSGSRRTWVRVALALLVLVLIAGWVVVERQRNTPEPVPPPSKEETAVAFLEAVAAGNAQGALSLSAVEQSGPFLTDQALRRSQEHAPISEVTVASSEDDLVVLEHRLGDHEATTTVPMQPTEQGGWQVSRAAAAVPVAPAKIPLIIDDQDVLDTATEEVLLFPGVHTLSTGARWLDYGTPQLVVSNTQDPPQVPTDAAKDPTADDAVREAVEKRLTDCAATGELAPERCPWHLTEPEGQPFDPGSVTLSYVGDPMAGFTAPELNEQDALAQGRVTFTLAVTAQTSINGASRDYSDEVQVETGYTTDLLSDGPEFVWSK